MLQSNTPKNDDASNEDGPAKLGHNSVPAGQEPMLEDVLAAGLSWLECFKPKTPAEMAAWHKRLAYDDDLSKPQVAELQADRDAFYDHATKSLAHHHAGKGAPLASLSELSKGTRKAAVFGALVSSMISAASHGGTGLKAWPGVLSYIALQCMEDETFEGSIQDIATTLGMTKSALGRVMTSLEAGGLVIEQGAVGVPGIAPLLTFTKGKSNEGRTYKIAVIAAHAYQTGRTVAGFVSATRAIRAPIPGSENVETASRKPRRVPETETHETEGTASRKPRRSEGTASRKPEHCVPETETQYFISHCSETENRPLLVDLVKNLDTNYTAGSFSVAETANHAGSGLNPSGSELAASATIPSGTPSRLLPQPPASQPAERLSATPPPTPAPRAPAGDLLGGDGGIELPEGCRWSGDALVIEIGWRRKDGGSGTATRQLSKADRSRIIRALGLSAGDGLAVIVDVAGGLVAQGSALGQPATFAAGFQERCLEKRDAWAAMDRQAERDRAERSRPRSIDPCRLEPRRWPI